MKIAVYDPLKTFPAFGPHAGKRHHVLYIDTPLPPLEREKMHHASDVVWYEFCTDEFVQDSRTFPKVAYVVNRLHSYELFTTLPSQANWDWADKLLVVSPHVEQMLRKAEDRVDFPPIDILFNGVDTKKFVIPPDKVWGKHIAVLGFINFKKNLPLAIQCLDAVRDGGYHMHFIGESQDRRFDYYLRHITQRLGLENNTHFHGKIPHDDLPEVLGDMDYIASFSLFESFGQGIMEGIACGCFPLVHDFPGARDRFWDSCIFGTASDFRKLLQSYAWLPPAQQAKSAEANRALIASNYSLDIACDALDIILDDIEREIANA